MCRIEPLQAAHASWYDPATFIRCGTGKWRYDKYGLNWELDEDGVKHYYHAEVRNSNRERGECPSRSGVPDMGCPSLSSSSSGIRSESARRCTAVWWSEIARHTPSCPPGSSDQSWRRSTDTVRDVPLEELDTPLLTRARQITL